MRLATIAITLVMITAGCLGGQAPEGEDLAPRSIEPNVSTGNGSVTVHTPGNTTVEPPEVAPDEPAFRPAVRYLRGAPRSLTEGGTVATEAVEPTLGVTPDGTVLVARHEPALPDWGFVRASEDQGATWYDATPKLPAANASVPPQTNDPYLHVDGDTGRAFLSNLQALSCSTLSFTDDGGDTWTNNPIGCGQPIGGHDHQTVFTSTPRVLETVGYPNVVHYCVNRVVDAACAVSLDGGLSFGPLRPLVYEGDPERPFCSSLTGHGTSGPDGTVYLPRADCGVPTVAISQDDGLTWDRVTISEDTLTWEHPGSGLHDHEVALAVDEASNAYAFWIGEGRTPYLAVSTDGGHRWADPLDISPPGVQTTSFPTIAAGQDGSIALAYYGTTAPADPGQTVGPNATWHAYLTLTRDATASTPQLTTLELHPPGDPVARGSCSSDDRCHGVGDFIDVVIDPDGRPWTSMADVCHGDCVTGEAGQQRPWAFVGTVAEGPSLRSEGALASLTEAEDPSADGELGQTPAVHLGGGTQERTTTID